MGTEDIEQFSAKLWLVPAISLLQPAMTVSSTRLSPSLVTCPLLLVPPGLFVPESHPRKKIDL